MTVPGSLGDLCRYILSYEEGQYADNPVRLGAIVREYASIQSTPNLLRTIGLVRSLGIKIEAVDYLKTGGTNMLAKGCWYIHYSAKDKPATRKFTIFHELFEIIHKNLNSLNPDYALMKEPQISRCADRFAAAVLIPPDFFLNQAGKTGCDLVKLAQNLELSHQCLLIALGQHFAEIPFIGVLFEHRLDGENCTDGEIKDFMATLVVKTPPASRIRSLCGLQTVPARNAHPQVGSLVCAAVTSGHPVLWRSAHVEDSPAILVRPLRSVGREPYRVIMLAIPNEEFGMISLQAETIEPVPVNGDTLCPSRERCRNPGVCFWKNGRSL
ncbi:ImmA/IrrE family metallo-endopeptidase [Dehalococcoides mccartyi]|uniref:IrrE N-terminal-like domain-containing protein n=1 Tax=Dehalococcoides mccartyi (strain VS) TaxID=311424 RepID=D2BGC8_DEHMV|nr:ImmA/IrrE family metallo-endopeptidase [Dehalococcoides mccartyi]ACZ61378.1 hypothetical protein DhcVS_216 [Dehalococcoides mccartyi VS]